MRNKMEYKEIKHLYDNGASIKEISKITGISYGTIYSCFRRNKIINADRIKLDMNLIKKLAKNDLSCAQIARKTGYKEISVYNALKRNNISFHNGKTNLDKQLSNLQKNVIIGSLYGDFSLDISPISSRLAGTHSIIQEKYLRWKLSFLNNINITIFNQSPKPDKRTGKVYEVVGFTTEYNSCFNEFNRMYKNDGKELDYYLLYEYYNGLSLAIHFMDDGSKHGNSYVLATNCFSTANLEMFQEFLRDRFNLETSIWKSSNVLYVKVKSRDLFRDIIKPYIHEDMQYKLIN